MGKYDDIWIQIQQNQCYRPTGLDSFIKDLEESYHVQSKKIWLPAACEDNELWISIFLNSPLTNFIAGALVSGAIFDLAKFFGGKLYKFFASLTSFEKKGPHCFKLENLIFEFDDISIKFYGLQNNAIRTVSETFQQLTVELPRLHRMGVENIVSISLPVCENDSNFRNKYEVSSFDFDYDPHLWMIVSAFGCERIIYDFSCHKFIERI